MKPPSLRFSCTLFLFHSNKAFEITPGCQVDLERNIAVVYVHPGVLQSWRFERNEEIESQGMGAPVEIAWMPVEEEDIYLSVVYVHPGVLQSWRFERNEEIESQGMGAPVEIAWMPVEEEYIYQSVVHVHPGVIQSWRFERNE